MSNINSDVLKYLLEKWIREEKMEITFELEPSYERLHSIANVKFYDTSYGE